MKTLLLPLIVFGFALTVNTRADEIRNGNFENSLKAWSVFVGGVYQAPAQVLPAISFEVGGGMVLRVADLAGDKTKPASVNLSQKVSNLEEGKRYRLSFSVKVPAGEKALAGLGIPAQSGPNRGNIAGGLSLSELAGTGGWVSVDLPFVWNPLAEVTNTDEAETPVTVQFRIGLVTEFGLRNVSLVGE